MQPLIGATCEALGIPNNPHTAYQIARNKFLARKVLGDAGLATTKVRQKLGLGAEPIWIQFGYFLGNWVPYCGHFVLVGYSETPRPIPFSCCPGGRGAQHG
jgi:hypothetical protein